MVPPGSGPYRGGAAGSLLLGGVVLVLDGRDQTARQCLAGLALGIVVQDHRVTDHRVVASELYGRGAVIDGARGALLDLEVDRRLERLARLRGVGTAGLRLVHDEVVLARLQPRDR